MISAIVPSQFWNLLVFKFFNLPKLEVEKCDRMHIKIEEICMQGCETFYTRQAEVTLDSRTSVSSTMNFPGTKI